MTTHITIAGELECPGSECLECPKPGNEFRAVGYTLYIPNGPQSVTTEVGLRPEGPTARQQRQLAWSQEVEAHAKRFHHTARSTGPIDGRDFMGFPDWYVIIWANDLDDQVVFGMRDWLEDGGYHVSSLSVEYEPPMA